MFDLLNGAYDRVSGLMSAWAPEWSCALISAVAGVLLLLCFKFVSTQRRIENVKGRMTACILGVWLYRDQPAMIARCQVAIVGHGLHYLALSLLPLVVFALPMTALFGEMNAYYGYRPVSPHEPTLVSMTLDNPRDLDKVTFTPPDGINVEATVADPAASQRVWRISAQRPLQTSLLFDVGGKQYEKRLSVGDELVRLQPERERGGFWTRLIAPSEAPLAVDGPVKSIRVAYENRELRLLRWDGHWLWSSFAAMTLAILLMRHPMRVAI